MAEEMTVPGVGGVDKRVVIGVAAVGAGVVGYAWWQRSKSAGPTEYTVDPNDAFPAGDRIPPAGGGGGGGGGSASPVISTDGEWMKAATDHLIRQGYEPEPVNTALGKYLGGQKLSTKPVDEVAIVRTARGLFGNPPQSGDLPIRIEDPTPGTPPVPGAPPEKPDATPPGTIGNFWHTVTTEKWLGDIAHNAYHLNRSDPNYQANLSYDSEQIRRANPQINWAGTNPVKTGLRVFIPPIAV